MFWIWNEQNRNEQIYVENIENIEIRMPEPKKPSFIQNIGKTIRRTIRRITTGKKDSSYTKSLKKLEKLKEPTSNVSEILKEENDVIKKLQNQLKTDNKRKKLLKTMKTDVTDKAQKEKKMIHLIKKEKEFMQKLKNGESKLKKLQHEKKSIKTDPKIVETFPDAPMSNYPSIPEHNVQITRKNQGDDDMEDDLEDKLGNVPIAFIRHISYEKKNPKGGKTTGRKTKRNCKK